MALESVGKTQRRGSAGPDGHIGKTQLNRLAFIGNSLPRRCGIATFTTDLQVAIARLRPDLETAIVAMTDDGQTYDYPPSVHLQINDAAIDEYHAAADFLNQGRFGAVCLQHEFGIFGGEAGGHIMALLQRLTMPVVTTLHTVLVAPTATQRLVLGRVIDASSKVVVMAEKAYELLSAVYRVPVDKIEIIPHGIPDFAFVESDQAKAKFGFSGKTVILTFGLLSPNKGIEVMIDAMPAILKSRPDAVYVVLGATHPNLIRRQGESYRDGLAARARDLGIADHVVFLDRFVDQATLLDLISMCDVYVTPYLNEAQMTSGTLAYSFGLGKPVVSTPYWHARELLTDGRGTLVPFGDAEATGSAIAELLTDDIKREAMRLRAYTASRSMTWEQTAKRYLAVLEDAQTHDRLAVITKLDPAAALGISHPPDMQLDHFLAMCDDTGLFQHAIHSVPDRSHGYCVDDNARALLLACALNKSTEEPLSEILTSRLAAFVQHAWNPDTRRFRNFMSFDRRWLEDTGSEDSHGRTLWALGVCSAEDSSPSRRRWAAALFAQALPTVESFSSPRAWAFTLLGLDAYCAAVPGDGVASEVRKRLADRLLTLLRLVETSDWTWFEEGLSYDNARLPHALIVTGVATGNAAYVDAGFRSLRWLMTMQTAPSGHFRPVGTEGFGEMRVSPRAFDQQPLEAAATISACLAAGRADGDVAWAAAARCAFAWFIGGNDLLSPLADLETGGCRDGLHPDRPSENRGGESVLAYLLSLAEIRELAHASGALTLAAPVKSVRPERPVHLRRNVL